MSTGGAKRKWRHSLANVCCWGNPEGIGRAASVKSVANAPQADIRVATDIEAMQGPRICTLGTSRDPFDARTLVCDPRYRRRAARNSGQLGGRSRVIWDTRIMTPAIAAGKF